MVCADCDGIFTPAGGTLPCLGETYKIVKPHFTTDPTADERARYFDFTYLYSEGIGRRHGWFDPKTGLLTQTG